MSSRSNLALDLDLDVDVDYRARRKLSQGGYLRESVKHKNVQVQIEARVQVHVGKDA